MSHPETGPVAVASNGVDDTAADGTAVDGSTVDGSTVDGTAVDGTAVDGTAVSGTGVASTALDLVAPDSTAPDSTAVGQVGRAKAAGPEVASDSTVQPSPTAPEVGWSDSPTPARTGPKVTAGAAAATVATGAAAATVAAMGVSTPAHAARMTRRPSHYAAAVYGSVLAATVVISAGDLRAPVTLAALLISSGLVFWVAHVYAATVASVHGGWHYGAIRTGMAHEWPLALASIPPAAAALVAGLIPGVSLSEGVWAALIVALAEQQLWGYAAVKNARLSGSALTTTVLLNVFMGFIIVALKLAVGH